MYLDKIFKRPKNILFYIFEKVWKEENSFYIRILLSVDAAAKNKKHKSNQFPSV